MRKLLIVLVFIGLFLETGCWDRAELNETTFVTGLAIDKGKNHKYLLTIEQLNAPALDPQTGTNQTASIIFSQEGDSIAELAHKMNTSSTRKLIYSHMRTVVISKEIAEEGMLEFIEYMDSNREIRNDFNFLIVDNAQALDVLKITYPIQRIATFKLNRQLETMIDEWGGDPDVRLKDFIHAIVSPGRDPILAIITIKGSPEKGNKLENMEKVQPDAMAVLTGLGIFKGLSYQGKLPIKHTRNYLLLQDKLNQTSITVSCAENLMTTARINNSKTKIKAYYKNDIPHFSVDISLEGILDATQCYDDFAKSQTYLEYEKKLGEGFEKEIEETIEILQEKFEVDIFGFGEHMQRQDYKSFKKVEDNWDKEFAKAEITVDVRLKLRRAGLKTKPFLLKIE